ncbi:MAG: GC-type dockerin domain-anchored protein [Planctomycetota bacterium]
MINIDRVSTRVRRSGVAAAMMACVCGGVVGLASTAQAQVADPLQQYDVPSFIDSGPLGLPGPAGGAEEVIFSATVSAPGAGWSRVRFDAEATSLPNSMRIRVTSLHDNHDQNLNSMTLEQWKHSSAYFNGNELLVEVLARPGDAVGRVVIDRVTAGSGFSEGGGFDSICGPTDDRQLSSDPRNARLLPVGCTAWIIDDCAKCFITAGHCTFAADVVEFNVPLSTGSGSIVFAAPEDQYPVDDTSMQSNGGQGVGNDWAYFGTFPNSDTGLTAGQAQGEFYVLADSAPSSTGDIRITGYGSTGSGVPPQWNQVQKTHLGPFVAKSGFGISYQTDTTGGNSGSPVLDETTGLAIGVHTHAGCGATSGNNGTAIDRPEFQDALANPRGVCCPPIQGIEISAPDLDLVAPGVPFSFPVTITELDGTLDPGSAELFYAVDGGAFISAALTPLGGDQYEATLPALDCGQIAEYYVRATTDGDEVIEPSSAPGLAYDALSATDVITVAQEDFQAAPDWQTDATGVDEGGWQIGVPNGRRGAPAADFDGSGRAFITGSTDGIDLDGGPAVLTSPVLDLSSAPANAVLSYARYFFNDDQAGGIADPDRLVIEISDDAGASWTQLESVSHDADGGQWVRANWTVADFVDLTSQVQVRFTAGDTPNDSILEIAIDAFEILGLECGGCRADFDGDGELNIFDFLAFQNAFNTGDLSADFDGDGDLTLFDFLEFQNEFDAGC